ncbi:G-type lectin S-receptor-like serine/threonine-protein kinase At1g61400 [Eucalyptus grandis]|uniref:G-type lectin S-receptor-like serine/threonine-protein kinase At1g61400 n=1 Tax=Eucalyptus grandis TaxID=71139 RepID=UPI00192EC4E6|nr:G-type lectin S-receptor-like serine/threonine-protein kinase At1g61400 [Eucalyptus grandis]
MVQEHDFLKVVWVANRDKPLGHKDQSASLIIGGDGNLKLLDGRKNAIWSTNVMAKSNYSAAVLLDFGNLVLQDGNANKMWESFDEPTDTLLPNMKIGVNVKTGKKKYLISWKGEDDPSPGSFVLGVTSETPPQLFAWNGSSPYWRSGQWDKSKFNGIPTMSNKYLSGHQLVQNINQGTTYYFRNYYNNSFGYVFISSEGSIESVRWGDGWSTNWEASRTNRCEIYGTCGPFGVCDTFSSPICSCLKGFKPRSDEEWNRGNWTGGCVRKMELNCQKSAHAAAMTTVEKDVFWPMKHMKLPDSADYLSNIADAEGCRSWCLGNCSCLAFSYVETVGCMAWCKNLIDTQQFSREGKDLFLRLVDVDKGVPTKTKLIISLSTISGIMLFGAGISVCGLFKWRDAEIPHGLGLSVYAFGYDECNAEFVLLRVVQTLRRPIVSEVSIYKSETNVWRRLQGMPYFLVEPGRMGVYLCGRLHWIMRCECVRNSAKVLVAFDIRTESFVEVDQPNVIDNRLRMDLAVLEEHLCLTVYREPGVVDVWIMREYGLNRHGICCSR